MERDEWFTLSEVAERLGALVWVETQLAELLTGWSSIESEPAVAVHFATVGRHHRWHAHVIGECLPTMAALDRTAVVVAPTAGWQTSVETLRGLVGPDATSARLRSIVKVIDPWVAVDTASLLDLARPISDAAMCRWLRFVELDHHDDGAAAAELLANLNEPAVRFDDHLVVHDLDLS